MSNLAPRAPLDFLRERLRLVAVEEALVSDRDLLDLLSDGYQRACERAAALRALATIPVTGREVSVPGDFFSPIRIADEQGILDGLDHHLAAITDERGYVLRARTILLTRPTIGSTLQLAYVRTPPRFAAWLDVPELPFGAEHSYLLAHYARWRVWEMSRGAAGIGWAQWERSRFERGVEKLRAQVAGADAAEPQRITSIREMRARAR